MPQRDVQSERQRAHLLIDALSAEKVTAVRNLLEAMLEPLSSSLAKAAVEDEKLTPETAALDQARDVRDFGN